VIGHHIRNSTAERDAHFNGVAGELNIRLRGELRIQGSGRSQVIILPRRDISAGAGVELIAIDAARAGFVRPDQIKVAGTLDALPRAEHIGRRACGLEGGIDRNGDLEVVNIGFGLIDSREGVIRDAIGAVAFRVEKELEPVIEISGAAKLADVEIVAENVINENGEDIEIPEIVGEIGRDAEVRFVGLEGIRGGADDGCLSHGCLLDRSHFFA